MPEQQTYSLQELIQLTGYDRRTIAYYVQQGLLPRIGRRGPRTRYPQKFLDRLLYIKRVRELQDTGVMPVVTLAEIRDAFEGQTDMRIRDVAAGHAEPGGWGQAPDEQASDMSEQTVQLIGSRKRTEQAIERHAGSPDTAQLKKLMADLERRAVKGQQEQSTISAERWTQVPITDNLNLAVKGIRDADLELAAELGQLIRRLGL